MGTVQKNRLCAYERCPNVAAWIPYIKLFYDMAAPPAIVELHVFKACGEHKPQLSLTDIIPDMAAWQHITDGYAARGLPIPLRLLTEFDWREI